jgi:hypothetical protein
MEIVENGNARVWTHVPMAGSGRGPHPAILPTPIIADREGGYTMPKAYVARVMPSSPMGAA